MKDLEELTTVCIVDGHHGIYVPQLWAEIYAHSAEWHNAEEADIDILLAGPDHEFYWEAWENVLNSDAYYIDRWTGSKWHLCHEMDLFAVRSDALDSFYDQP